MPGRTPFKQMDLVYGRERTLVKFTMLEFIARVPYQAWERMGYLSLSRRRRRSALAKRVYPTKRPADDPLPGAAAARSSGRRRAVRCSGPVQAVSSPGSAWSGPCS